MIMKPRDVRACIQMIMLIGLLNGAAAVAEDTQGAPLPGHDVPPPLVPESLRESAPLPPPLLQRPPLPAPPPISCPPPLGDGVAKPPLAWRAKACSLASR